MASPKPAASLSPTLLARKGGAKPAMRSQLQPLNDFHEATARDLSEDLGWNDMGDHMPGVDSTALLTPMGDRTAADDKEGTDHGLGLTPMGGEVVQLKGGAADAHPEPANVNTAVLDQRDKLAQSIVQPPVRRKSAFAKGKRAAFTLRIDPERHLKLRLASTIANRSAQQLVTEALDRLLAEMPEVETLASNIRNSR